MTWTTANLLTLARILLIPFILFWLLQERFTLTLVLFLVMALTDIFDGYIARRWQQRTILGSYLDPIADKLLLVSVFICLACMGQIPVWLVIWTVLRDLLIPSSAIFVRLTVGAISFPPTIWGKMTTFFQLALVLAVLLVRAVPLTGTWLVTGLIWLTLFFTLFSGFHYIYHLSRIVSRTMDELDPGNS
jgi:cardiolipin synthase